MHELQIVMFAHFEFMQQLQMIAPFTAPAHEPGPALGWAGTVHVAE